MANRAIVIKPKDNVATALEELAAGTEIMLDIDGNIMTVLIQEKIPVGHKFALKNINKDDKVVKYGEPIGCAVQDINVGQHVHVHNMAGLRGRGDL